jgi:hypothetical protein
MPHGHYHDYRINFPIPDGMVHLRPSRSQTSTQPLHRPPKPSLFIIPSSRQDQQTFLFLPLALCSAVEAVLVLAPALVLEQDVLSFECFRLGLLTNKKK